MPAYATPEAGRATDQAAVGPLLRGLLERDGERSALRVGERALSYGELRGAVGAVAERLAGRERIGVWAEPTLETCVAIAGALVAGVPAVPINPKLGEAELRHVLEDSAPEVVFGAPAERLDEALAETASRPAMERAAEVFAETARASRPVVERVDLDARAELPADAFDPERPALIVYTSGTTGPPKGAILSRRALAHNLDALAEAWAWTADDLLVHALPLFHVHGLVLGVLGPLRLGGALHHLGRFEPDALAAALGQGATLVFGVPTMYHRLAEAAETEPRIAAALGRARLLVSGSAPLPGPDFERIERLSGQRIAERYGLTETLIDTAVRADGERRAGYVGLPLRDVELRLVADDGSDVEARDDETLGEVVVRGPSLFSGYLDRPDATATALRDGWFHTGDIAARAPDGYLRIVGRRSTDLIKTGGYKVGAGEVETALLGHPGVAEVAVVGRPDDDLGERIVAFVVSAGEPASADELIAHVADQLTPHKRPRELRFVEALPRNALGKVVKQRLED